MMTVIEGHHSLEGVAGASGIPLHRVMATSRNLVNAELAAERETPYYLTEDGFERLRKRKRTPPAGS